MDLPDVSERKPDWLDKQCTKISAALDGLTIRQKLAVIEQTMDYLRMEEADTENHN